MAGSERRLRVLLAPFGSEGDTNPLVWLARGLRERGHECEFLITPHYASRVEGFDWHPLGTEEDFERLAADPTLWHPLLGTFRVAAGMQASLGEYRRAFRMLGGRFDLVVATSFAFGPLCVAEARRIPRLITHLQPVCFRSLLAPPVMGAGGAWIPRAPRVLRGAGFRLIDLVLDSVILPGINRFRKKLRLEPWRTFYRDGLMGSGHVAGLFPEWFCEPQPDWPPGARLFGFPAAEADAQPLPEDLESWLSAGPAPVLWTHGSANWHVRDFQRAACRVSGVLGIRALLVSRKPPADPLPEGVRHVAHVPFERIFSRCSAVVHHGGIGTTAKAFAAGLPQLVVPLAHDQFDNALRVERLGCGLSSSAHSAKLEKHLRSVLHDPHATQGLARCRSLANVPERIGDLCAYAEAAATTA